MSTRSREEEIHPPLQGLYDLMVSLYSNCEPSAHNDIGALSYLARAGPVKVDAKKAMADNDVFAKLKPADVVHAANVLAYQTLNLMFEEGIPAEQLIHTGGNDDSIPIGSGFDLLE
jgi:hypothetical protein